MVALGAWAEVWAVAEDEEEADETGFGFGFVCPVLVALSERRAAKGGFGALLERAAKVCGALSVRGAPEEAEEEESFGRALPDGCAPEGAEETEGLLMLALVRNKSAPCCSSRFDCCLNFC